MRKNLKWIEIQPGIVAINDKARMKELAGCYINNLAIELRDHCPVRKQIGEQYFPVYKQTGVGKSKVIAKISDTIPVDWYRRLRKEYKRYGTDGVLRIIRNLKNRFNVDNLDSAKRVNLSADELKEYQTVENYFLGLLYCINNNCLPKREHHVV